MDVYDHGDQGTELYPIYIYYHICYSAVSLPGNLSVNNKMIIIAILVWCL